MWRPFESLRREVERLFDEFDRPFRRSVFDVEPFWRRELSWAATPTVDIAEKDNAFEILAELPGMDEKNVEVKVVDGGLTIRGKKEEEKEEKRETTMCTNATSAPLSARSDFRKVWTPTRLKRRSRKAC